MLGSNPGLSSWRTVSLTDLCAGVFVCECVGTSVRVKTEMRPCAALTVWACRHTCLPSACVQLGLCMCTPCLYPSVMPLCVCVCVFIHMYELCVKHSCQSLSSSNLFLISDPPLDFLCSNIGQSLLCYPTIDLAWIQKDSGFTVR